MKQPEHQQRKSFSKWSLTGQKCRPNARIPREENGTSRRYSRQYKSKLMHHNRPSKESPHSW